MDSFGSTCFGKIVLSSFVVKEEGQWPVGCACITMA